MARLRTKLGCPNCRTNFEIGTLYLVEPRGCRFSFLFYTLMIGIPIMVGIILHSFNSSINLWDWMFHSFPNADWYTQNLWHFVVVAVLSAVLAVLIALKVFGPGRDKYLCCDNCGATFLKGRGSTVIPFSP